MIDDPHLPLYGGRVLQRDPVGTNCSTQDRTVSSASLICVVSDLTQPICDVVVAALVGQVELLVAFSQTKFCLKVTIIMKNMKYSESEMISYKPWSDLSSWSVK